MFIYYLWFAEALLLSHFNYISYLVIVTLIIFCKDIMYLYLTDNLVRAVLKMLEIRVSSL